MKLIFYHNHSSLGNSKNKKHKTNKTPAQGMASGPKSSGKALLSAFFRKWILLETDNSPKGPHSRGMALLLKNYASSFSHSKTGGEPVASPDMI